MEPPTCRNCGSASSPTVLDCPRCGHPTFRMQGRRDRNTAFLGMVGSAVLAGQSAFMLAGGAVALYALAVLVRGDLAGAIALAGTAALLVGVTLLFDLLGIALLSASLYRLTKRVREGIAFGGRSQRAVAFRGLLASVFLVLWLLVTIAWRAALAAVVSFYPTPLGLTFEGIRAEDIRLGAAVMLGLWVAAAVLLLFGAVLGSRFLQRVRRAPSTVPRFLWPMEMALHAVAAVAIAVVVPDVLASTVIDLAALRAIQTLGVLDLLVVPILGVLAYAFLFREFYAMHREASGEVLDVPLREAAAPEPPGDA